MDEAMEYGKRPDDSMKGMGYFGEIKRPDGNVMTEISIGVGLNGKETLIPLIVPTLNKSELNYLMKGDPEAEDFMDKLPKSIIDKAVDHAVMRMKEKKSPFADDDDDIMSMPDK
jgi:hypothetical protein